MKLQKKYPLLFNYFLTAVGIFTVAAALGIFVSTTVMRHIHFKLSMEEFARSCEIIARIKHDKNLNDLDAFNEFIKINPEYLDVNTSVWDADGYQIQTSKEKAGASEVSFGEDLHSIPEENCHPIPLAHDHPMAALRLSPELILKASLIPSRVEQIAHYENIPNSYRIFRKHPVVYGLVPEKITAIVLLTFLLLGFAASMVTALFLFRRASLLAGVALEELKNGNLKARFQINGRNPSGVGGKFNEMADEIEKLVNHLRFVEGSRANMLQELAHDLKTPVASLSGLLESLHDHGEEMTLEKRQDFLNTAIGETYYFSRLVEDLLFISGVTHPHYKMETHLVDLVRLIRAETQIFEKQEGLSIKVDGPDQLEMIGEELLLKRLIRNAVDNATSFAISRIHIHLFRESNFLNIWITDDGKGVSIEAQKSFGTKRAARHSNLDQTDRISLGLGSVIMRKIAQLYGGDVHIEAGAQPYFDHGTTLKIQLKIQ